MKPRRRSAPSRLAASLMLALAVLMVLTMSASAQDEPASQPDIVVIYLDDVDPHDARLWKNPERTPTLSKLFGKAGVQFTNAVSETPLCSPGRAALLTGRHTANHGVADNVTAPFDPRVTIGTEMREAGYHTIFSGKYLNGLRDDQIKPHQLKRHAKGWDEFDIIYENNGRYINYRTWSPDGGIKRYGAAKPDHSTLVTKRKLVEHLKNAPADKPLFAVASVFDLHDNNLPADKYVGDTRCQNIKAWTPDNFGVKAKGKEKSLREFDKPSKKNWRGKMQTYCEQMLGVEELTEAIVKRQDRRGRLDDTVFILTADNGVAWGIHRLPQRKGVPYATPIPLVFSSPSRWGDDVVEVDEVVSNIDVAPTICALAGCEMGPFREGPEAADGLSLTRLLDGETSHLDRTVVREERSGPYSQGKGIPAFEAIRTTSQHPLGRFHYIEWDGGHVELYDSVEDPYELTNLAKREAYADIVEQLAADLEAEFRGTAAA